MVATLLERMPVGEGRAEQERIARGSAAVAYSGGADTVSLIRFRFLSSTGELIYFYHLERRRRANVLPRYGMLPRSRR